MWFPPRQLVQCSRLIIDVKPHLHSLYLPCVSAYILRQLPCLLVLIALTYCWRTVRNELVLPATYQNHLPKPRNILLLWKNLYIRLLTRIVLPSFHVRNHRNFREFHHVPNSRPNKLIFRSFEAQMGWWKGDKDVEFVLKFLQILQGSSSNDAAQRISNNADFFKMVRRRFNVKLYLFGDQLCGPVDTNLRRIFKGFHKEDFTSTIIK